VAWRDGDFIPNLDLHGTRLVELRKKQNEISAVPRDGQMRMLELSLALQCATKSQSKVVGAQYSNTSLGLNIPCRLKPMAIPLHL
jgi:hypothetical protein